MPTNRTFKVNGGAASKLLKFTSTSGDAFPPLKNVAGDGFRTSRSEWKEFQTYVQDAVATVIDAHAHVDPTQSEVVVKVEKLQRSLGDILKSIEATRRQGRVDRFLNFMKYSDMIAEMTQKLDNVIDLFTFGSAVRTEIIAAKTLKMVENNSQQLSLNKLQYVRGASWDPHRVCLSDTRKNLIDDILSWIDNPRNTNILLLTGVAGSGKSTVAHTISQLCVSQSQLVTSFFFDRETNDRNNPSQLITTITADLAHADPRLATNISSAIDSDRSLTSAPISRQFDQLILQPCQNLQIDRTLVIVLDALDEGCDPELLRILCNDVSRLPSFFRLVLTSRMHPEIGDLRRKSHVQSIELDIDAKENMDDIAVFIPHRLKQVADRHELDDDWPGKKLASLFEARAGGLFLWVATICDFLCTRSDPTAELQKLVSVSSGSNVSAEAKMDRLYTTILQACDWTDEAFVEGYQRLMGTVIATKAPLTLSALSKLFNRTPLVGNLIFRQLSPLLTGLNKTEHTSRPVRFLHLSLRDFLTLRATTSHESRVFAIDEKAHSQTLAHLCLRCLNQELNSNLPDAGYLAQSRREIPSPSIQGISEWVWYACRFWMGHLVDVDPTSSGPVLEEIQEFLKTKFTSWVEIRAVRGKYESISSLIKWVREAKPTCQDLVRGVGGLTSDQASKCLLIANHLDYMDRREEALESCQDAVEIYRLLCSLDQGESSSALASALIDLSFSRRRLGLPNEALSAANEAVELYRQLRVSSPDKFTSELAIGLGNISANLSELGCYNEALEMTQEAIGTWRRIVADDPDKYNPRLAASLHDASNDLANQGHYEEALLAIQEAVDICRKIAADHPDKFTATLAQFLRTLSMRLCSLKRYEQALESSQETVKFFRKLAVDRPIAFASDLALSLETLSIDFTKLGRYEEALKTTQEAVEAFRRLAADRPALFTSRLVSSLLILSAILSGTGQHEEALVAVQEAISIVRGLVDGRPVVFVQLARCLGGQGNILTKLDRPSEAIQVSQEAVQIYRQLANDHPTAYSVELGQSLHNLAVDLSDLDRHEEAVTTVTEAVEIHRGLATNNPTVYTPELAGSLIDLSVYLRDLARHEQAHAAAQEAVELSRRFSVDCPDRAPPLLAQSLYYFSLNLSDLERHQEALIVARESVELYRSLVINGPKNYAEELSMSLTVFADELSAAGAEQEAQAIRDELNALTPKS
ncbi:hypothetical protein CTheo_7146 [Ceratobasidium theobromae]|uniref:TPR-like protein n=1 Tax=Ceratobasidium theobromae TaxID=1582974 RepID=A0A5N5QD87_9AGAM|nr:hypothetical protein CTheo_7146 [Ceratobasidium theobromae]